jgi:predicted nicotinamide N-methyase
MNAELNQVSLDIRLEDLLYQQPPATDVILVGDYFMKRLCRVAGLAAEAQGQGRKYSSGIPGGVICRRRSLKSLPSIMFR